MTVEIHSACDPDALMERIRAATDPESGWSGTGPAEVKRFRGTLVEHSVAVRLRTRSKGGYAFGPEFMGNVEADPAGSVLRGRGTGARSLQEAVPIVATTVLELAALAALVMLPLWLWRRRLQQTLQSVARGIALD